MTQPAQQPDPDFPRTAWGFRGYRCEQVDQYVDRMRGVLRSEPLGLTPNDVAGQRFDGVRFRRGYAMRPVDEYLDGVQSALRERGGADTGREATPAEPQPRHFPTGWIYLAAALAVAAMVAFVITQL